MRYLQAPDHTLIENIEYSIFLAGGITNCSDWQLILSKRLFPSLRSYPGVIINPRRNNFPINDPSAAKEQIEWEFHYLNLAKMIVFWFPPETLCPITLFELGNFCERKDINLIVGCHPDYQRKLDVEIQLSLRNSKIRVVDSLHELGSQILTTIYSRLLTWDEYRTIQTMKDI